ncbi:3386_t:CDS:2 [Diversispora eburnea]|uniref:3386_t:CDS:1 n=1 Tax=Diversispora eburnea TaxID=1213867 RepID=A0A9N8VBR9_9GLOM|nr:3386_t:CDS:2 [Diversispora eburnea]
MQQQQIHSQSLMNINNNQSILPIDTLAIILDFLSTSKTTLYSCLLVNRLWCRLVIPHLWSDPFSLSICDYASSSIEKNSMLIIETYINCLNKDEKQRFVEEGIIINYNNNEKKPLFDYPRYLKYFDSNLIFKQTIGIKTLCYRNINEINLKSMDISNFTNTSKALFKLENLDIVYYPSNKYITYNHNKKSSQFLYTISLSLSPSSSSPIVVERIFSFIKSQRHLQYLSINEFFPINYYKEFCDVLNSQANSLKYVKLSEFNFFPYELESILINSCNLIGLEICEHLVLRLNTNNIDSNIEIIDNIRDILDSLPSSVNHIGLEMNFGSIRDLCVILNGCRSEM